MQDFVPQQGRFFVQCSTLGKKSNAGVVQKAVRNVQVIIYTLRSFESNLNYQQEAIKSITDLFEGQPINDSIEEFNFKIEGTFNLINGAG